MKVTEYAQMMSYLTRPKFANGGRIGFANGTPGKSAVRKPFAPEIEKQIIKLHQVDKMGAEAIANELGLSRAPVGKRITALKKEGKIKDIPYSERKAAIDQRGEFFNKPASEKFQTIREVRDIDRTTRIKDTGKLKYNIPKDAKFKIDFKTTDAALSEIPKDLQGIQYYKTKEEAQKALDKRKNLKLVEPADPDSPKTKGGIKRRKLLKRNAPLYAEGTGNFEFHHIMNIGGEIPLDTNDIAVLNKTMNRGLQSYNKRLNKIGEDIVDLINEQPEGYLKKIEKLNNTGEDIVKNVVNKLPKKYKNYIGFNRVVPVTDEYGTPIDFVGKKFGGMDTKKPAKKLEKLTKIEKKQISDLVKSQAVAGKTGPISGMTLSSNPFFDPSLMKKVISDLGKGVNVGLGPTGILALNTALGVDPTQSIDRAGLGLEAALAKPLVKGAVSVTDQVKNPTLRKIAERAALAGMSPTMAMKVASRLSPVGIASLGLEGLYQVGKLGYEDQQRFNELSPEEQAAERAEQEKFAFDIEGS